ncbi:glycosyltransferase family 1 protein [filamentous cyanobacterium CCP2]|nr:glycosyltransferase family 1 protein [filamentous cyanobacterium CCP2]
MESQTQTDTPPLKIMMLGPALEQMGGMATVENLVVAHAPSELKITHIATHDYGSVLFRIKLFLFAVLKTIWILSTKPVDVVHILLSQRGSAWRKAILTLIVRAYGKPVVLHAQSSEFHVFFDNLPQPKQQVIRWVYQKCAHFIALSESWKKYYMTRLNLDDFQVVVLPNPVQLPEHVPSRSVAKPIHVLFLGRIGQRKGAFDLIEAFATLSDQRKAEAHLTIAGDGEVEKARAQVQRLNLSEFVTILDWLNPEQRDTYLAKSDVFVLPTRNEGLPLALLEAMGWGLPSITTPVGGIPELVTTGKDGILVEPGNVQQIASALTALIENEELRFTIGENARKRVEPLNIHNYCNSLLKIYRSALEEEPIR